MNKWIRKLVVGIGMFLLAVTASYAWYFQAAVFAEPLSFAQTRAALLPHIQVLTPNSDTPRPAVLLFHGCGGPRDYGIPRAQQLAEQGYVAILIDSYTGRGVDWQLSCAGRVLPGYQRAADVLVALDFARSHPAVDADQLFIMGYSHGGWTILEALANGDALPPGLTDSPGNHLQGLRGIIAWYPYCGFAAQYRDGWDSDLPVLMLLAAEDHTTAPEPCIDVAKQQASREKPVNWNMYPGVDHGFDVQADWVRVYDPDIHRQALRAQYEFLSQYSQ